MDFHSAGLTGTYLFAGVASIVWFYYFASKLISVYKKRPKQSGLNSESQRLWKEEQSRQRTSEVIKGLLTLSGLILGLVLIFVVGVILLAVAKWAFGVVF